MSQVVDELIGGRYQAALPIKGPQHPNDHPYDGQKEEGTRNDEALYLPHKIPVQILEAQFEDDVLLQEFGQVSLEFDGIPQLPIPFQMLLDRTQIDGRIPS